MILKSSGEPFTQEEAESVLEVKHFWLLAQSTMNVAFLRQVESGIIKNLRTEEKGQRFLLNSVIDHQYNCPTYLTRKKKKNHVMVKPTTCKIYCSYSFLIAREMKQAGGPTTFIVRSFE